MFLRYHRRGLLYSNLEKSARKDFNDDQKTLIQYFRMVQDRILDGETTLEKDASVTDWQLNDMISFQKETILIRLSLIVQSFDLVIVSHFRSENVSSNCMKRLMSTM